MRHAAIVLLSLVSIAPAHVIAQGSVAQLVEQLGAEDRQARYTAYRQLQVRKTPATLAALTKALPKFDASAQSRGLSLVTSYQEPQREAALRRFLKGKPSLLRLGAAVWVHQRGDQTAALHMVQCLRNPGPPPALNLMLGRLWNVKAPSVVQAVQDLVNRTTNLSHLATALRMLARAKARGAIPKIQEIVSGEGLEPDRRALCAAFLVVMGETRYGKVLAAEIPKIKSWSRVQVLLREAAYLDKSVLAAILEFAEGQRGVNIRYALELLAKHAYRPAVSKMRHWLASEDSDRCKAALNALMTMGEELPLKELRQLLACDVDELCVAAADALRRVDEYSGLPWLIKIIERGGPAKSDAVQVLGKFRDRRAIPVLIRMLDDADSFVRSRAYNALPIVFRGLFPYRRFDFATTGYHYSGPVAARRAAIAKIQKWWNAQSGVK